MESYAYILKQEVFKSSKKWEISTGYFFAGRCYVYGTLIVGDNGVTHFQRPSHPATQFLYPDICPPENGAFVK